MAERLQKAMASAGIASRRKCEDLIRQGRVQVNGVTVTELGQQVDLATDRVTVDGRPVGERARHVYVVVNKPRGYLSTARDERGRPTVIDLVPSSERVYPVGRLDLDSEGLLLLTNDGELANLLTHPRYEHEKEYRALVRGAPSALALNQLVQGVVLEDGLARADEAALLESGPRASWLRLVLHEGRKRQVRRMCEAIGHPVQRLIRIRFGPLALGDLPSSQWRPLTEQEIDQLTRIKERT